jgi:2-C-methyl-D-erythritol 4-phosphate cytidylyltransferase
MYLLIPAAGSGRRMGSDRNKLLLNLCDKPLLAWTLIAAEASLHIDWIGIIGQPVDFPQFQKSIAKLALTKPVTFVVGGDTRQESVYNGLAALPPEATKVLIHDGARCLATADLFDRCSQALQTCSGLIAAIPVKDTIKVVDRSGLIEATPDRNNLIKRLSSKRAQLWLGSYRRCGFI